MIAMPFQTTDRPQATKLMPPVSFNTLLGVNRAAFESWMVMNRALASAAGRMAHEYGAFVARRLADDVDCQKQLVACRTPSDVVDLTGRSAQTAVRDYMDEATRLSVIAAEMVQAIARPASVAAPVAADPEPETPAPAA